MTTPLPDIGASIAVAARSMDARPSLDQTLLAIVHAAQVSVPGFDHAGISTVDHKGRVQTRAGTGPLVEELDNLQYGLGEGPCVDALRHALVVAAPAIRAEQRWPRYVSRATRETGLQSQLAVRMFLDEEGTVGTLNLYSTSQAEIDPDAESVAELFATHAAIALGRAREISTLNEALLSRRLIGQAIGIVMERYKIDEDRAFAFLARASSHGNIKLRDVAKELVDTARHRTDDS